MAKKLELEKSGLGDISDIFHNTGISDLSWLDVDPEDYHKAETLPKQNLDIIPELQRALTFDDSGVPALIPLRPHTMVNTNPLDPPDRPARNLAPEITNRVAKYVISGFSPKVIKEKLLLEFSSGQIRQASENITEVISERGLLGNVYVDSKHFPRCAQDSDDKRFIANKAKNSKFVVVKNQCASCLHNHNGMCANLHKKLVESVPYNKDEFSAFASELVNDGRLDASALNSVIAGSDSDRKKVLQLSFCSSPHDFSDNSTKLTLRQYDKKVVPHVAEEDIARYLSEPRKEFKPISKGFVAASNHLTSGGSPDAIVGSTDLEVRELASSHGLLGHTYLDMDSLGGCEKTLNYISSMKKKPDFVYSRFSSCSVCNGVSTGSCAKIRSLCPIVDEVKIDKKHFALALVRAVDRGVISSDKAKLALRKASPKSNWKKLTAQANLLSSPKAKTVYLGAKVGAHYGSSIPSKELINTPVLDSETVRKLISHLMNRGLSGRSLTSSVLSVFSKKDLASVSSDVNRAFVGMTGVKLAKLNGVQGSYFIDPTAYPDYGKGCQTGSRHFRKRGALNVLAGPSCTGCSMQSAPGWCSKYAKGIIRNIPQHVIDEIEEQRSFKDVEEAHVENPVEKYELVQDELVIEPKSENKSTEIDFFYQTL
jgi:hypothetical protein